MNNYLQWKKSYITPSSYDSYLRWNIRFRKFLKKDALLVTLNDVRLFKEHLIKKGYSPKNVQYGLTLVKDYIGYLMTVEGMDFPMSLFKIQNERGVSHYALTEKEYQKMLIQVSFPDIQSIQRRVMMCLMWETGMRVGELLSLRISQLASQEAIIFNEKNKRSRMIAWSRSTEKLLKTYLKVRKRVWSDEDYVFVALGYKKKATKMTSRQVQRFTHEIAKDAKVTNNVSPHSFRHGFVHRQLASGKPVTTVAQMLGHSTSFNVLTYHQLSGIEVKEAWRTAV